MLDRYLPEGRRLSAPDNLAACASKGGLLAAQDRGAILEGRVLLCDANHDLIVRLGPYIGRYPGTRPPWAFPKAPPGKLPFSPG